MSFGDIEPEPVPVRLTPLFEARWSYDEFKRVMPFGPDSEGQAYAHARAGQVDGERLSGSFRLAQYPRWRVDRTLLPDVHGVIETDSGDQVVVRAAGYGLQVPGEPENRKVIHWMRFWTAAKELGWLNSAVAFGTGSFVDEEARLRYFVASPAHEPSEAGADGPALELLGTARWEYEEYDTVRQFGDNEGVGFASSIGDVIGGSLAGRWRGWHYPTYLRNGLYQLDAHAEISGSQGPIISRHGGLATPPAKQSEGVSYDVVQHATFLTAAPGLAKLNSTLAVGVGFVLPRDIVRCSYYSLV